jgi:hypothetical protein
MICDANIVTQVSLLALGDMKDISRDGEQLTAGASRTYVEVGVLLNYSLCWRQKQDPMFAAGQGRGQGYIAQLPLSATGVTATGENCVHPADAGGTKSAVVIGRQRCAHCHIVVDCRVC